MTDALQELQSIHSMLASGQRSVRLERHSLLLMGAVGGFLAIGTDWVITPQRFPEPGQQAVALLCWLGLWLGGISLLDQWLTRRARQRRAETIPFAQAQVTRAWWLLLGVGTLGSFAMFFYGGGRMVYALWIVLLGLGIFLFGLFSRPLVEWIGVATILLGVLALAARLPFEATRWLTASCFVIGLPLAGWLISRSDDRTWLLRTGALLVWILAVVAPALLAVRLSATGAPQGPALAAGSALGSATAATGEQVLRLAPGTRVPVHLDLDGPILGVPGSSVFALTVKLPVELALKDGQPDGRYRLGSGPWRSLRQGGPDLLIDRIQVRLDDGNPGIRAHASLTDRSVGEQP